MTDEGQLEQLYADCPRCGESVSAWCDCPGCGGYDADEWERKLVAELPPDKRAQVDWGIEV